MPRLILRKAWGNRHNWFEEDAFARYLLPPHAATPPQAHGENESVIPAAATQRAMLRARKYQKTTRAEARLRCCGPPVPVSGNIAPLPQPNIAGCAESGPGPSEAELRACSFFMNPNRRGACTKCGFSWADHYGQRR
jgi:hypothetical protein